MEISGPRSRLSFKVAAWSLASLVAVVAAAGVAAAILGSPRGPAPVQAVSAVRPEGPAVSGSRVVYADRKSGNYDIFLFDAVTGLTTRIASDGTDEILPAIYGDRVVYVGYARGTADIYLYDIIAGTTTLIAGGNGDQVNPSIWGDRVVWEDYRTGYNSAIVGYDVAASAQFEVESGYDKPKKRPRIAGDIVVWEDYSGHATGREDADVRYKNLLTGVATTLDNGGASSLMPATDGRYIVWASSGARGMDIFGYDTQTGLTYTVRSAPGEQTLPSIGGGVAYWLDNSGSGRISIGSFDFATGRPARFDDRGSGSLAGVNAQGASVTWLEKRNARWEVRAAANAVPVVSGLKHLAWPTAFSLRAIARSDTTSPRLVSSSIRTGQASVAKDAVFTLGFSEALDPASVAGAVSLADAGGKAVAASVSYSALSNSVAIDPAADLPVGNYQIRVSPSLRDVSGNPIGQVAPLTFTTLVVYADTVAPGPVPSFKASTELTNSVRATWGAAGDDIGVTNYRLYRYDAATATPSQVASVSGSTFTTAVLSLADIPKKFVAYYAVRAFDASGNGGPTSTLVAPDPHGTITFGFPTGVCTICHTSVHGGGSAGALGAKSAASCYKCHGNTPGESRFGTASTLDVQAAAGDDSLIASTGPEVTGYNRYVHRNAFMAAIQRECNSCHSPHKRPATTTADPNPANGYNKLLRTQLTTPVATYRYNTYASSVGNTFCFDCHGSSAATSSGGDDALTKIKIVGGDLAYVNSRQDHRTGWNVAYNKHADTSKIGSTSANPGITCTACHDQHGTKAENLLGSFNPNDGSYEISGTDIVANDNTVCYACHANASPAGSRTASGYPLGGMWPGRTVYSRLYDSVDHTGSIHGTSQAGMQWPGTSYLSGDCKNCHDLHGSQGADGKYNLYDVLRGGTTSTPTFDQDSFGFCFTCHDGAPGGDIRQYYPTSADGSATQGPTTRYGHKITSTSTVLPSGSALPCYYCHNPHGSQAGYGLEVVTQIGTSTVTTLTIGDAVGEIDLTGTPSALAVREFCFCCHTTGDTNNTSGFNGSVMTSVGTTATVAGIKRGVYDAVQKQGLKLPPVNGHRLGDTTESCYKCHGRAYGAGTNNVHNPSPGLSTGGQPCYGCHSAYKNPMEDGLGSQQGTTRSSFYHHVLGNAASDGDTAPASGAYPTSQTDVFCVSCHTDHNYFNGYKARNLRASISNSSGNATLSTDFVPGSGGSTTETLTLSPLYAAATSPTPVSTWTNSELSTSAPDGSYARSNVSGPFLMEHYFTGFPGDWQTITGATITVAARGNRDGWGRTVPGSLVSTPSADGNAIWTESADAGTNRYDDVDEYPTADDDTTYIDGSSTTMQRFSTATTGNVPANATNIDVAVYMKVRDTGAGTNNVRAALIVQGSATEQLGTNYNPTTSWYSYVNTWTTNPVSAAEWTAAQIRGNAAANNLQFFGPDVSGTGTSQNRVTQCYLVVTYDVVNDDQWAIQYSTNGGASWSNVKAAGVESSTPFQDYSVAVSGLTTVNASNFRVRTTAVQNGSWDNSGTVDWDASRLDITYTRAAASGGGICLSCHAVIQTKQGQGSDQGTAGLSVTQLINPGGYTGSSHSYVVTTTFGDATVFAANCSKCHSDEQTKEFQTGTYKFGTHWSSYSGILRALGAFTQNPPAEQACFKCHGATGDVFGQPMSAEAKSTETSFTTSVSTHPLSKVTCLNCHNVHEATATAPVANADNTYLSASVSTTAGVNAFCLTCHDGAAPVTASSSTTLVVETVTVAASANVANYWATSGHGTTGTGAPNRDCRDCHEQHGSTLPKLLNASIEGSSVPANDQRQCFACHGTSGRAIDIMRYYPAAAGGTSVSSRSGHRTKTAGTLAAGSAIPCDVCHNPHGTATGAMLTVTTRVNNATMTLGDDANELKMTSSEQTVAANVRNFCFVCHATCDTAKGFNGTALTALSSTDTVLGISRTTTTSGQVLRLPDFVGHHEADTASCYLCHGDDFSMGSSVNVHNPGSGESRGKIPCYVCHTVYQDKMEDGSLPPTVGPSRGDSYHHVLGSGSANGDTTTYPTSATAKTDVFCLSCHVDHDLFSPLATSAAGVARGRNLRVTIGASAASKTADATNTDFLVGAGGVCLYCHGAALDRDNTNQASESNSSKTPTISGTEYDAAPHQYSVNSTFASDSSNFRADCSKCHDSEVDGGGMENGTKTGGFQTGANHFSVHYSANRRVLGAMGVTPADPPKEEGTCYACHSVVADGFKTTANRDWYGVASMNATSQLLESLVTSTYAHHVGSYDGLHRTSSADETRGYISANEHVECTDCHDAHVAQAGRHSAGTNLVSNVLRGVSGAKVTTTASNWTTPTTYSLVETATYEYEICFKCHSGFNTNVQTWGGPSGSAIQWTDVALEFNTSNGSYHPVLAALPAGTDTSQGAFSNQLRNVNQMAGGWTLGQKMYCSDCHASGGAASFGPHGAGVKWLLTGSRQAWPYTTRASNGTSGTTNFATLPNSTTGPDGLFCLNCHTLTNVGSVHTTTDKHGTGYGCVMCHTRVPHGSKASRLLAVYGSTTGYPGTMPKRYTPTGVGTTPWVWVTGFNKTTGDPGTGNCTISSTTGCGTHSTTPLATSDARW